ncbi:MAG: hypothetical protein QG602_1252 [Verrucomicrobiota bacterium]|nr:hypothetical protein [Verrucomicrobiota bacterium]
MLLCVLPWWRNHAYLRDLYDYGLVITANGLMERGERPYVNFTTSIQAGFLGLNWLAEKAGGGTYAALTRGAAGLILASGLLLPLMLVRRWPWWAALAVGGVVTVGAASQHTILWHNTLGVFTLALVAWASALAPVLRRADWPWHLLLLAGLFLGGINKLNFHLVALAVALAWVLRAGLTGRAGAGRVAATMVGILAAGGLLPLAVELAWTGASLELWCANVVGLAAGSRFALLERVGTWEFLLQPMHDYYGKLVLPQVGLAGVLLSLVTLAGCWREDGVVRSRLDRVLLVLAVLVAATAGAALLATNFEIAWVDVAAWLSLLGSLWLGFGARNSGRWFTAGFVLPAVVLGAAAWWSAWQGQRSQFGYSQVPRGDYRPAESAAPAYASLHGLRLPPEIVLSLQALGQTLAANDAEAGRPVFYGPGVELLERYFPSAREKGQPLWAHWDTSYDAARINRLREGLLYSEQRSMAFTTVALAHWPEPVRAVLDENYVRDQVGPAVVRWRRQEDVLDLQVDSFATLGRLGGNLDGRVLHFERRPLRIRRTAAGVQILGTTGRTGQVLLRTPVHRMRGMMVLSRLPGAGNGSRAADFKVIVHGAVPEDVRWSARVELPAGQETIKVPFEADGSGRQLLLLVMQAEPAAEGLLVGYRELEITHAGELPGVPALRPNTPAASSADVAQAGSLFGDLAWRPAQLAVRAAAAGPDGLELSPGGEIWLHSDNMVGEFRGRVTCPASPGRPSVARVVWYKGGRLQILQQEQLSRDQPFDFRGWTAEPGGWFGVLLDGGEGLAPARVRITRSALQP